MQIILQALARDAIDPRGVAHLGPGRPGRDGQAFSTQPCSPLLLCGRWQQTLPQGTFRGRFPALSGLGG